MSRQGPLEQFQRETGHSQSLYILTAAEYLYLQHSFDDRAAFQPLGRRQVLHHDATANYHTHRPVCQIRTCGETAHRDKNK